MRYNWEGVPRRLQQNLCLIFLGINWAHEYCSLCFLCLRNNIRWTLCNRTLRPVCVSLYLNQEAGKQYFVFLLWLTMDGDLISKVFNITKFIYISHLSEHSFKINGTICYSLLLRCFS